MALNREKIVDYIAVSKTSIWWSISAAFIGAFGGPISIEFSLYAENVLPMLTVSFMSLSYLYLARKYLVTDANFGRRSRLALIGISLTFLWAPSLLFYSLIFLIIHI
jgi:hypothetical protein